MEKTFEVKKGHNCLIVPLAGDQNDVKIYNSLGELIRHSRSAGATEMQQTVEPGVYRIECDGTIKNLRSTSVDLEAMAQKMFAPEALEAPAIAAPPASAMAAPAKAAFTRAGTINKDTTIQVTVNFTITDANKIRVAEVTPVTEGVPLSWSQRVSRTADTALQYVFSITNHSSDTSAEYEIKILEI